MRRAFWIGAGVAVFLGFWGFGMVTSLASSSCINGLSTPSRTNTACKISRVSIFLGEMPERKLPGTAVLYTGCGVASFADGDITRAEREFETAIQRGLAARRSVAFVDGVSLPDEFARVTFRILDEQVPEDARLLWWTTLHAIRPDVFDRLSKAAKGAE